MQRSSGEEIETNAVWQRCATKSLVASGLNTYKGISQTCDPAGMMAAVTIRF